MLGLMDDLYAYNDWANDKVIALCSGLSDAQLDMPREMGFGTLRATLFHILTAEVIWMERWQGVPWRPFPKDPEGMSVAAIADGLKHVAHSRRELMMAEQANRWSRRVEYQDSTQTPFDHRLSDLLLHVVNHGVHHRAQALNYLKQFDRTVVAGIDYCFYRLAKHAVTQSPEAKASLKAYGLEVSEPSNERCPWDAEWVTRQFQYNDWATRKVLAFSASLTDEQLDRDFAMGPGSIRKTLLHLMDAEAWWITNWNDGPRPFPQTPESTSVAELSETWPGYIAQRNAFIANVDDNEAERIVEIAAGGPHTRFRVGESIPHLALHGTHHRAQLINMFRHVGAEWTNIDLLYAIDDLPEPTVKQ
ncbi:DinB family protein [Novipirellula rosea]|uniref:DinB family protein n=1 Tax=Novipirellula rosea TaxID=1031540 RepID=A0ABP8N5F0_9BACT